MEENETPILSQEQGFRMLKIVHLDKSKKKQSYESQHSNGIIEEKVSNTDFEDNSNYDAFIDKINEFK